MYTRSDKCSQTWGDNGERIDKYGGKLIFNNTEEVLTVKLEWQPRKHLGICINEICPEPGIFSIEILEYSITEIEALWLCVLY